MATFTMLKNRGLHTADKQLGAVPEGSAVLLENCVQYHHDIVEPRRGQPPQSYSFASGVADILTFYKGTPILGFGALGQPIGSATLARDTGSAYVNYSGTYTAVDRAQQRMKFVELAQNLYLNAGAGLQVLDAPTNAWAAAGVPKGMDAQQDYTSVAGTPNGNGTWLSTNNAVAARVVFGIRDANNSVKLGAPSGRAVVVNPADVAVPIGALVRAGTTVTATVTASGFRVVPLANGGVNGAQAMAVSVSPGEANFGAGVKTLQTANQTGFTYTEAGAAGASTAIETFTSGQKYVMWTFPLPPGITTSHFVQLYRSYESGGAGIAPSDELFLAQEVPITAGMVAAGYVTITDQAPSTFLGQPLYTNPITGSGILQANERPPIAKDICEFDNRMFYFNTTSRNRFFLNLLGTAGGTGLANNDTITIAGTTFTAKTTPGISTDFQLYAANSPAQNIEYTARALINQINVQVGFSLTAFYVSGPTDPPGKILLEERAIGGSAFTVYASNIGAWAPGLTTSSSGALTSKNDRYPSGVYFSADGQPEAVPITNWFPAGSRNKQILRGIALRNKVFLFKEDSTIWTITGKGGNYRVDIFDGTANLVAPDTAVVHNNQIFALTTQGVVSVSDAGVRIVSKAIKDKIDPVIAMITNPAPGQPAVPAGTAFAVSYEADNQYQLWTHSASTDSVPTQCWVYNSLMDHWDHWPVSRSIGKVNPSSGVLYVGDGAQNFMRVESKTLSYLDFYDGTITCSVVSQTGTAVTVNNAGAAAVGDVLVTTFGGTQISTIIAVNGNVLTVADAGISFTGAATIYQGYACTVKSAPVTLGKPSLVKHFRDETLHFKQLPAKSSLTILTDTEKDAAGQSYSNAFAAPFGVIGQAVNARRGISIADQQATQLRTGFSLREAFCWWQYQGFSLEYEVVSERNSGGAT